MPWRPDSYAKGGQAELAPGAHGSALTAALRKARRRRAGKSARLAQGRLTPVAERGRGAQNKGAGGGGARGMGPNEAALSWASTRGVWGGKAALGAAVRLGWDLLSPCPARLELLRRNLYKHDKKAGRDFREPRWIWAVQWTAEKKSCCSACLQ